MWIGKCVLQVTGDVNVFKAEHRKPSRMFQIVFCSSIFRYKKLEKMAFRMRRTVQLYNGDGFRIENSRKRDVKLY